MADPRIASPAGPALALGDDLDRVSPPRRVGRALAESWFIAERNLILWRRSWLFMTLTLVQPVMFFILFRFVLGQAIHVDTPGGYTDYIFAGVAGQTCAVAAAGTALTLGRAMTFGTVDRYRSLDIARSAFLLGRLAADVVRILAALIFLLILGFALGLSFRGGWPAGLAMMGLGLLFGIAMCCVSAYIGMAITSQEAVQTYGFLWIFPLTFASSAFVPVSELPGWLQGFARDQPFTVVADAMRDLILGGVPVTAAVIKAVAWSLGLLIVFAALATRAYSPAVGMTTSPGTETFRINDVEVRIWGQLISPPEGTEHILYLHKDAGFLERENMVLDQVKPRQMVEVGLLQGGDAVYWTDRYRLERLCAIDIAETPQLESYVERNGMHRRIRLHNGVSQDDPGALIAALAADFDGEPLDAVIDDASHLYAETRATFQTLFPFLRPGAPYIIEDWAWGHLHDWPADVLADVPLMSPLLTELMLVVGHHTDVIRRLEIDPAFTVAWRGEQPLPLDGSFRLAANRQARGFSVAF